MVAQRDVLSAGDPVVLPSGRTLLLVSRLRTRVQCAGGWRAALVQREPHALLLRDADGRLRALALGPGVVSLGALRQALPDWEAVVCRLGGGRGPVPAPPDAAAGPEAVTSGVPAA